VALIVLDASVLIAQLDRADAHHQAAVKMLREWAGDDLRLPASAYSEALVDAARQKSLDRARELTARLGIQIEPIAAETAEAAARLRALHRSLRLPDALVLACGDVLNADAVVTSDRSWRRYSKRVSVIGSR
jgi:predicted nucleic acid-binding protein